MKDTMLTESGAPGRVNRTQYMDFLLRKLKPVNIPILFTRSTAVCCNTKTGSKG